MEPIDPQNNDIHPDPIVPQTWDELFGIEGSYANSTTPGVVNLAIGNDGTLYANSPTTPPVRVILPPSVLDVAGSGWVISSVFSITDSDTVAWGAGTLTTEAGDAYSIGAGNTGNMAAKTYIYFDVAVSETALQTTTTAGTSVGAGKILIAIAEDGTDEATFMVLNDNQYNVDAANIVANSITGNELAVSIAYAGSLVIDPSGNIRSGQTAYNTGDGWWVGNDGGTAKLSMRGSGGDEFTFDGVELIANGAINTQILITTLREFDGSTTPVPLYVNTGGFLQVAEADVAEKAHFIGFSSATITDVVPDLLSSGTGTSASFTATGNAGTNRVLVVQVNANRSGVSDVINPTGGTWGGNALTVLDSDIIGGDFGQVIMYRTVGTSGSNQAQTLALTGGTYDELQVTYGFWDNVNQADPIGASLQSTGLSTDATSTITPERATSLVLALLTRGSTGATSWNDGLVNYQNIAGSNTDIDAASVEWNTVAANAFNATIDNNNWIVMALELNTNTAGTANIRMAGVQTGFAGLTIGSSYYVSNTEGVISTTPGSTTVLVGKTISATQLLIVQT